jgi:hypothetical protein
MILTNMVKSTLGSKLPRWRSTIKCGTLLSMYNYTITSYSDVTNAIKQARDNGHRTVSCIFATVQYVYPCTLQKAP